VSQEGPGEDRAHSLPCPYFDPKFGDKNGCRPVAHTTSARKNLDIYVAFDEPLGNALNPYGLYIELTNPGLS
jgi:hypothetical protein